MKLIFDTIKGGEEEEDILWNSFVATRDMVRGFVFNVNMLSPIKQRSKKRKIWQIYLIYAILATLAALQFIPVIYWVGWS